MPKKKLQKDNWIDELLITDEERDELNSYAADILKELKKRIGVVKNFEHPMMFLRQTIDAIVRDKLHGFRVESASKIPLYNNIFIVGRLKPPFGEAKFQSNPPTSGFFVVVETFNTIYSHYGEMVQEVIRFGCIARQGSLSERLKSWAKEDSIVIIEGLVRREDTAHFIEIEKFTVLFTPPVAKKD